MTWEQIKEIFLAARELTPAERKALLDQRCAGQAEARREIEELLFNDGADAKILDEPAIEKLPEDICENETISSISSPHLPRLGQGQLLGSRYEVVSGPREGAMGQVYPAYDTVLERNVALKVLPDAFAKDTDRLSRFKREAQVLASLEHPNICTVHDIRHDDGVDYIVMEYIDGETLTKRLERPLTVSDFKTIAEGCLEALRVAHQKRIPHRDIKPDNIMLNAKGEPKLVDFGLAKPLPKPRTDSPSAQIEDDAANTAPYLAGTPAYMARELFLGGGPDSRSDIYSLGVVFYQLLYGRHPFPELECVTPGDYRAFVKPRTLKLDSRVSRGLNGILRRMLSDNPVGRYDSAAKILEDLRRFFTIGRLQRVAAVALLVMVGAIAMPGVPARINLVVLGFESIGGPAQDQVYADGWTDIVTRKLCRLSQSSLFQVPCPEEVLAARVKTPEDARSELGANVVLSGTLSRLAGKIVVSYSLIDPSVNRPFLRGVFKAASAEPLETQNEFLEWLIRDLKLKLEPQRRPAEPDIPQAAFDSYILGRGSLHDYENPDKVDGAISAFGEAVRVETNYAEAYAGLGEAYLRKFENTGDPDWIPIALKHCEQSVTINSYVPEARTCLGALHNSRGDYTSAMRELEMALKLQPANDFAYRQLAESKKHLDDFAGAEEVYLRAINSRPDYWAGYAALGRYYYERTRYPEAAHQYEEAIRRAPENGRAYYSLGGIYILMSRYDDAIATLKKSIEIRQTYQAFSNIGSVYMRKRRFDDAVQAFEQSVRLNNRDFIAIGNLARAYHFAGKPHQARPQYELAIQRAQERFHVNPRDGDAHIMLSRYYAMIGKPDDALLHVQQALISEKPPAVYFWHAAVVYNLIGDFDKALSLLNEAVVRTFSKTEIRDTVEFDNLRNDQRFTRLMELN